MGGKRFGANDWLIRHRFSSSNYFLFFNTFFFSTWGLTRYDESVTICAWHVPCRIIHSSSIKYGCDWGSQLNVTLSWNFSATSKESSSAEDICEFQVEREYNDGFKEKIRHGLFLEVDRPTWTRHPGIKKQWSFIYLLNGYQTEVGG